MPSLVAVACFFPGQAKDLSAPPRVSQEPCKKQYRTLYGNVGQRFHYHYKYVVKHTSNCDIKLDENKNNSVLITIVFFF